jgi:hypothetical protein
MGLQSLTTILSEEVLKQKESTQDPYFTVIVGEEKGIDSGEIIDLFLK